MLIQNFQTFVQTLRQYEIEGGFGKSLEKGYELYYGFNVPQKINTNNKRKAWKIYKENYYIYDKFITRPSFITDEYIKKIKVYDNGGQTMGRYTIMYPDVHQYKSYRFKFYVGACKTGQSFFQHGEVDLMRSYSHLGKVIEFDSLHERLKNMILQDI